MFKVLSYDHIANQITGITNFNASSSISFAKTGKTCYAYISLVATSEVDCESDFVDIASIPSGFTPAETTSEILVLFWASTFKSFQFRVTTNNKVQVYGLNKIAVGDTIRGQLVYFVS